MTYLPHGTTVATNAMLEREGVPTGVITTAGFEDVIKIGREKRDDVYDTSPEKPPTFTERRHRFGVPERIGPEGTVHEPLDEAAVREAGKRLAGMVDSVAVSFLHAYQNDAHERTAREILESETDLSVSISSAVQPEIREYERTLTTVVDAYVAPKVADYVDRLRSGLDDLGIKAILYLMQANGGVTTVESVRSGGVRLINSGPAGGVHGIATYATDAGFNDVVALNVGGTSADACLVEDGEVATTTEGEIDGIPLLFRQLDVRTVGAGGGSVAWLDGSDTIKVGPKSAGARPGPACYGHGGDRPTMTDAALLLGYLDPGSFLGGEMRLDTDAAEAVLEPLADAVGTGLVDLADGVLEIGTTNVSQAIRLVSVERGRDPREFVLACYGGAGPLFATRVADHLDVDRVYVPPASGVLSAAGLLTADTELDFARSVPTVLGPNATDRIAETVADLRADAAAALDNGFDGTLSAETRYAGQTFTLDVTLPDGDVDADWVAAAERTFHRTYESVYGEAMRDQDVEVVTWHLRAVKSTRKFSPRTTAVGGSLSRANRGARPAYDGDGFVDHDVYDRDALPAQATFRGPAIVEETNSTTVLGGDWRVLVDDTGGMVLERMDD